MWFLMVAAVGFMALMAIAGWITTARVGFDPKVVLAALIGTVAVAAGIRGAKREQPYLLAGGTLAAGLMFPTPLGIAPMIGGFVLFILIVSLQLFINTFEEGGK